MRNDIVFKIGNTDYSKHVIVGTYNVNNNSICKEYTDAGLVSHKVKIRDKVSGKFDMYFKTIEEYDAFVSDVKAQTISNQTVPMYLLVNNTNEYVTQRMYIKFEPKRTRDILLNDRVDTFSCEVEQP